MSTSIRVRGALVLSQRAHMERIAGRATVRRAIDALPPGLRDAYDDASMLSWVPQRAVRDVTRLVANDLGMSAVGLAERIVRTSVTELCAGPWNILLRLSSDEALLSRATSIFARAFDVGRIDTTVQEGGAIEVVLRGWPAADDMDIASVSAGIRATLEAVGRLARVQHVRTPDGARYRVHVSVV